MVIISSMLGGWWRGVGGVCRRKRYANLCVWWFSMKVNRCSYLSPMSFLFPERSKQMKITLSFLQWSSQSIHADIDHFTRSYDPTDQ